jgi:hypothetical protein
MRFPQRNEVMPAAMAALLSAVIFSAPAAAQSAQLMNTSVPAAGRGNVTTAVFWEPITGSWKNPALLGYQGNLEYVWAGADMAANREMTVGRLSVGHGGAGLLLSGWPTEHLGGTEFSMKDILWYNAAGELVDLMTYRDEVRTVALGINCAELAQTIAPRLGVQVLDFHRWADLSVGIAHNQMIASFSAPINEREETGAWDWGYLLRVTPLNTDQLGGVRLDGAFGQAWSNFSGATTQGDLCDAPYRLPKIDHLGGMVRLMAGSSPVLCNWFTAVGVGWLTDVVTPLVSVAWGHDLFEKTVFYGNPEAAEQGRHSEDREWGYEITLLNIFTVRRGHIEDDRGKRRDARGWALGLCIGDFGGLRYDYAKVPEREDFLGDWEPESFTVYCDPWRIWESWHGSPE